MNKRYDQYLVKKYEPLYRDRYGNMQTTAMCWGFEVGDGWFSIINNLSHFLCAKWLEAKREYEYVKDRLGLKKYDWPGEVEWNVTVTQEVIDEAFAKMQAEAELVPVAIQVKEKYGTLRFYINRGSDEQWAYIAFAEAMSACTCEICGNRGRVSRGMGWVTTRCKEHEDS